MSSKGLKDRTPKELTKYCKKEDRIKALADILVSGNEIRKRIQEITLKK